jgi:hypothetical protein
VQDFVVFYQPSFESFNVARFGSLLQSKVDCFHPNACGHALLAYLLFNSLQLNTDDEKSQLLRDIQQLIPEPKPSLTDRLRHLFKRSAINWNCPNINSFLR